MKRLLAFVWIAVFAAAGCASAPPRGVSSEGEPPKPTVVVIGAGMAGLACARELADDGRYRVIVLEARDRIGGRVHSYRSRSGGVWDLGASWIHGVEGNPMTALARRFDVETAITDNETPAAAHASDGAPHSREHASRIERRFQLIRKGAFQTQAALRPGKDLPLKTALDQAIRKQGLGNQDEFELRYFIHSNIEQIQGMDAGRISLRAWEREAEFEGKDATFPRGYGQLTENLARGLDIRLKQVVTRIRQDGSGVDVVTADGGVVHADSVVVTVSVGVLKSGKIAFEPALPRRKVQAIGRLDMALLDKVYLRFPRRFWPEEPTYLEHYASDPEEWTVFYNQARYTKEPVLMAFRAGARAANSEKQADEEIVERSMRSLRTIYGKDVPEPVETQVTRWGQDPFAYGTYSFLPVGATEADMKVLAEPVDRVFFAGEATSGGYYGTVHGAYLSGLRAAYEIKGK